MRRTLTVTVFGLVIAGATAFPAAMNLSFESEYAGGTVAAIPVNTKGQLDLSDSKALKFHYGTPTYAIEYAKITNLELTEKSEPRLGRIGGKALPFLQKKGQSLNITFAGANGKNEMVMLDFSRQRMSEIVPMLESRTGKRVALPGGANAEPVEQASTGKPKGPAYSKPLGSTADGQAFWGDRYWKTERNQETWSKK